MRALTACVILLSIAGCASQTQPRSFSVQVFEQRGRQRAAGVNGQHAFVVRIMNRSEEPVAVDSVQIDPQSTSLQFYENAQAIDEMMQPGEMRDIPMWISVNAVSMNYVYGIDSVDVAIAARSAAKGSFTERTASQVIASQ